MVELSPENREAWHDLAETLYETDQAEDALEAYRKALSLNPNVAGTYLQQAKALMALGRSDESLRSIEMALRLDPKKKDELLLSFPDLSQNSVLRGKLGLDRT